MARSATACRRSKTAKRSGTPQRNCPPPIPADHHARLDWREGAVPAGHRSTRPAKGQLGEPGDGIQLPAWRRRQRRRRHRQAPTARPDQTGRHRVVGAVVRRSPAVSLSRQPRRHWTRREIFGFCPGERCGERAHADGLRRRQRRHAARLQCQHRRGSFAFIHPEPGDRRWHAGASHQAARRTIPTRTIVDGSPSLGDAYWASNWHTVLAGGLNKGGQGIYALDVTNTTRLAAAERSRQPRRAPSSGSSPTRTTQTWASLQPAVDREIARHDGRRHRTLGRRIRQRLQQHCQPTAPPALPVTPCCSSARQQLALPRRETRHGRRQCAAARRRDVGQRALDACLRRHRRGSHRRLSPMPATCTATCGSSTCEMRTRLTGRSRTAPAAEAAAVHGNRCVRQACSRSPSAPK